MQKVIKVDNNVIVLFEDGTYCESSNLSHEDFVKILNTDNEEEVFAIMNPSYHEVLDEYHKAVNTLNLVEDSDLLTVKGTSIYWEEVSQLSLPPELAHAIVAAEVNNEWNLVETYKNFWTLMSLNPDEECRKNLFWFLQKWGLKLAKCGFFVAYRNVVPYETLSDGTEVYTDAHSGTTRIKIGTMVTMPRKDCDRDSSHSCSRGLVCSPVY